MGQIFSLDAIVNRRIPQKESFLHVARMMRATLVDEDAIVCALLFGSIVRGDYNIRSDADCLIVYKAEKEAAAMRTMQEITVSAKELYVPVQFTPCDTHIARTRLHHLGTSFVRHLQASLSRQGEIGAEIKGRIDGLLSKSISERDEIEGYIRMKMYKLQSSFAKITSMSDDEYVGYLQKLLEAPVHVARKMLIYEDVLDGDSKSEVAERYRETMPAQLADQFDILLGFDRWYNGVLVDQIRNPDYGRYRDTLAKLGHQSTQVLGFLRSNMLHLHQTARR